MSSFLGNPAREPSEVACKLLARIFKNPFCIWLYGIALVANAGIAGVCTETDLLCGAFNGTPRALGAGYALQGGV